MNKTYNLSEVDSILRNLRVKNINKLLIGNLNINSISGKFDQLKTVVQEKLDILVITETKLDSNFPNWRCSYLYQRRHYK